MNETRFERKVTMTMDEYAAYLWQEADRQSYLLPKLLCTGLQEFSNSPAKAWVLDEIAEHLGVSDE